MKVIQPVDYQPSMLVSTTVVETVPAYSSSTTYSINQEVNYQGYIYISATNSNLNNTPSLTSNFWTRVRADNRTAMFDRLVSIGSSATGSMEVIIQPGRAVDSVALINLQCDLATVQVTDGVGGPVFYEKTIGTSGFNVTDWYEYFFTDPLIKITQLVVTDIPPRLNCVIKLTLVRSSPTDPVSIGEFIFGNLFVLGETQYGANAGIVDYSRKDVDDFGNVNFVERAFSKRLSCQFHLTNFRVNQVQQTLVNLRAKPSVWIASEDLRYQEALIIYGFYRDFSLNIAYPNHSIYDIEIEGLT